MQNIANNETVVDDYFENMVICYFSKYRNNVAEDYPTYIHHIFIMSTNSNGKSIWTHLMLQLFNDVCNALFDTTLGYNSLNLATNFTTN